MGAVRTWVRELLAIAGITPSETELQEFEATYPELRRLLDRLHEVQEVRYGAPALVFSAVAPGPRWGAIAPGALGGPGAPGAPA